MGDAFGKATHPACITHKLTPVIGAMKMGKPLTHNEIDGLVNESDFDHLG